MEPNESYNFAFVAYTAQQTPVGNAGEQSPAVNMASAVPLTHVFATIAQTAFEMQVRTFGFSVMLRFLRDWE